MDSLGYMFRNNEAQSQRKTIDISIIPAGCPFTHVEEIHVVL
jgi:hypothetical protein